jgi:tRNA U38,U39,U40 pseudouridine synthase TruA
VMHELAHAYHDQFLDKGFENKVVKDAYNAAMESKKYESVLHWNGSETKHYATSNQMEYFSESTESYFGTNDFYPFVRAELKTYDPDTFKMLESVWGTPVKRK